MTSKKDALSKILTFQGKSNILKAIRGIHINQTLRAAVNLDLFSLLEKSPLSSEEIKDKLTLSSRGLNDFLDALVSLGLLNRDGSLEVAKYSNAEEVSLFLVKGSPQYIGWSFEEKMRELEQLWGQLSTALRTGTPQRRAMKESRELQAAHTDGSNNQMMGLLDTARGFDGPQKRDMKETEDALFKETYSSKKQKKIFVEGMNFGQLSSFNDFAKKFDFSPYKTLCDIGGANALFSIIVANHNKHLNIFSFDLPDVKPIADDKIEECGLSSRIEATVGDFFEDDFPKGDIITMGNILHDWNYEIKKMLIKKAYSALPDGGALVIIECLIDEERKINTSGLLMSLNMLLLTEGGYDFTPSNFFEIAKEIGFKKTELLPLSGDSDAAIVYK